MKILSCAGLSLTVVLQGCASYRPLVDARSVSSPQQYERDLRECQHYAAQVSPGQSAVAGALFGALLGVAISGAIGGNRYVTEHVAAAGAVQGAASGAAGGADAQVQIIRNCMDDRGYAVLD
jgi:outer membrane lipoprotein SlyB